MEIVSMNIFITARCLWIGFLLDMLHDRLTGVVHCNRFACKCQCIVHVHLGNQSVLDETPQSRIGEYGAGVGKFTRVKVINVCGRNDTQVLFLRWMRFDFNLSYASSYGYSEAPALCCRTHCWCRFAKRSNLFHCAIWKWFSLLWYSHIVLAPAINAN